MSRIDNFSGLGSYTEAVESTMNQLLEDDIVVRIGQADHTVWKDDPTEITDRLGWLTITERMRDDVKQLHSVADEVRGSGIRYIVLLGVGGSSLAASVLGKIFGKAIGYPRLLVLDSAVPNSVCAITEAIDLTKTLFLVSSKSGTTIEPIALYKHFRKQMEEATGSEDVGRYFIAITDPDSPLGELANQQGFRQIFENDPTIGGRYSALSHFGLLPAALAGVDVTRLLHKAERMSEKCAMVDSPGARLGAVIGSLARNRRDKLTMVTSSSIASFALWVEQLVAESTGKQGAGVVPVVGECLLGPEVYGDDRLFMYLRLESDQNDDTDAAIERLMSAGQPVYRLDLEDIYDLGAEFFRWEFATVVAGSVLGVQPFDQPNVQQAKDSTSKMLYELKVIDSMELVASSDSLAELLAKAKSGRYMSIMAYVHQTIETDLMFRELRTRLMQKYRIATTLGYGPQFLHSTGQLHKGGPDSGLFLQIVERYEEQLPIPQEQYTFGQLVKAQASGDLKALRALGRDVVSIDAGYDVARTVGLLLSQI